MKLQKYKRRRYVILSSLILISLLFVVELVLRFAFGFCDTVLIREDKDYEYIAQANQQRFRFGNHIKYNSLSMRSEEVDTAAVVILGFGDSVINGGVQTEQDSLATTILSDTLSALMDEKVQFLNISAGSWGPDNCYAYLEKHGDFGAKKMVLFVSSHDAYDNMNFEKIVGINKSFPEQQYLFGVVELVDRYLIPRLAKKLKVKTKVDDLGITKREKDSQYTTGLSSFVSYAETHKVDIVIYLHADREECLHGKFNAEGEQIIEFAYAKSIPLINEIEYGFGVDCYRDIIHVNHKGQRRISELVFDYLKE